jgi:hypothetical protein
MKNIVDPADRFFKIPVAPEIALDKFDPGTPMREILAFTGRKIIQNPDPVTLGQNPVHDI